MTASAARLSFPRYDVTLVRVLLLVGGALNGLAARMLESWYVEGAGSSLFGISPFEVIVLAVASFFALTGANEQPQNHQAKAIGLPELLTAAALLIPSSAVAWAAVAFYAAVTMTRCEGRQRTAMILFLILALCALWSSLVLKFAGGYFTTFEAWVVGIALSTFMSGVLQSGNVVGVPDQHTLIVMTACSFADGLPRAILGLAAVMYFVGSFQLRQFIWAAAAVSALFVIGNFIRLTLMATSAEWHALAHGPIGANVFDAAITLAVFALALVEDRK